MAVWELQWEVRRGLLVVFLVLLLLIGVHPIIVCIF
jgi:hypothetical protein